MRPAGVACGCVGGRLRRRQPPLHGPAATSSLPTSGSARAASSCRKAARCLAAASGALEALRRARASSSRRGGGLAGAATPLRQWAAKETESREVTVTSEVIERARRAFNRRSVVYLHHVVAAAFPHLPTQGAARRALKRGDVLVDGAEEVGSNVLAPPLGALLTARSGEVDALPEDLQQKLESWNACRSARPEARFQVLAQDADVGWAVVNKPAGIHTSPCVDSYSRDRMTFEDYLPALVPPPLRGTRSRRPRVCHRLDFRVAGPVVVTTAEETARAVKAAFAERRVGKEYRAVVCGAVGGEGDAFAVDVPVDGKPALTDVRVLRVAPCPHYGSISELSLRPRTGRYHQLRVHCAEALGAPIVNDEPALFAAAAEPWERRHGRALPRRVKRGRGNLFLQAVEVSLPAMEGITGGATVRAHVSDRFHQLLQQSERAWHRGWRTDEQGQCRCIHDGES
eukprot:CAMPEP_0175802616 /NCGR_PEP_ID=MMETSP0097-20121207/88129_1 /TAXON_ID=311494 /ORGANISM="Alexandrium monilatum, Strain CCMP3105" /LENGTH=456 /DNA_ID=CAMNT_0017113951 /DNA_START=229 /DNA_END=1596 /DNA_ORIENTATION=+